MRSYAVCRFLCRAANTKTINPERQVKSLPNKLLPVVLSILILFPVALLGADLPMETIKSLTREMHGKLIDWRRDFHQNPELSNREFRTAEIVAGHLLSLGMDVQALAYLQNHSE